ncbi:glycine betaine ABC transporter substrate-binding protein [Filobacillus milosensis]|uniref:Glycine betaine ABC transporter substrate-binding protein n=1 Tax=Filobacillus milosensis TaxID=94137 RepID=A0A4Y8INJ8_9BACI|nr:glycine betaine ABC transporter substrate-binding protein [Filobacillus milosensis]TFB22090.1 glycine betaine ABC transporter substrate-binding protein [Filobacillus milosensis]
MFKTWKSLGLVAMLALVLVLAACGGSDDEGNGNGEGEGEATKVGEGKEIELVYVEWDSEIASTNVVGKVLEDLGYEVKLTPIDNAAMWQSIASGDADGMVAAWLPATHGDLYAEYKDQLVDLGPNLSGAKIGLVVPKYMEDATTISDLSNYAEGMGQEITGIEAGAGVVKAAEKAVETYPELEGWSVVPSSSGAMATALGEAISNEDPIAVTGWTPHWKFAEYDLKYLEDPEGVFGGEEEIKTMVRQDLEEDMPNAYKVLDQFSWETADMESIMLEVQNGTSPEEAAAAWVEENQDKVSEWTKGVE